MRAPVREWLNQFSAIRGEEMKLCPLCGTDYPNQYMTCEADGAALLATGDLDPGHAFRDLVIQKILPDGQSERLFQLWKCLPDGRRSST
jgi:hypothetical protein